MTFDFDQPVAREGTDSLKHDGRAEYFGTADVLPLWVADMDFAAPPAIARALAARAAHPVYGYTRYPEALYEALIGWLHRRHGWRVERDWILPAPGVVPSLHAAALAFAAPGEGVIAQSPVYYPFFSAIAATGRRLVENPLRLVENSPHRGDDGYRMDFDHLEACAADARLLLLCSPHNPVGRVWTRDELARVLDIAQRHDLIVLSDEIHHDLIYPERRHQPLAALDGAEARVITAVSPSKTFNIPGLGLSALIAPDPAHRVALRQAFDLTHAANHNPFSIAAFVAGYHEGDAWLDALMAYLAVTRDFVLDFAARELPGIRVVPPEGSYLLWLDCRALGMSDPELRDFCVHRARLGMSPGTAFGAAGSGFMRLNLGAPRALIETALNRLAAALRER